MSETKGEFGFAELSALLFESTQVPPNESHKRIFLPTSLKTSQLTAYCTIFSLHVVCDPLVSVSVYCFAINCTKARKTNYLNSHG